MQELRFHLRPNWRRLGADLATIPDGSMPSAVIGPDGTRFPRSLYSVVDDSTAGDVVVYVDQDASSGLAEAITAAVEAHDPAPDPPALGSNAHLAQGALDLAAVLDSEQAPAEQKAAVTSSALAALAATINDPSASREQKDAATAAGFSAIGAIVSAGTISPEERDTAVSVALKTMAAVLTGQTAETLTAEGEVSRAEA